MNTLRVLITNVTLGGRSGTETYVRDLALGLLRAGHSPIVYTRDPGSIADELRRHSVAVVSDLTQVAVAPDLIHGHHHVETMTALLVFPDTPAVFVCHDRSAWHDVPPRHPRILKYVAVDENCRERLVLEHGIADQQSVVIPNSVDLERFSPRGSLPPRARSALVFGNSACESTTLESLREYCQRRGMTLDVLGHGVGRVSDEPESLLPAYDLVFAKARCALEALATGCAVVLYDSGRCGPLVTLDEFDRLRALNFGRRLVTRAATADRLDAELARYDPRDAAGVCLRVRSEAGVDTMVDSLLRLYRKVIAASASVQRDREAEARAAAAYLQSVDVFRSLRRLHAQHTAAEEQGRILRAELAAEREITQRYRFDRQQLERSATWRICQAVRRLVPAPRARGAPHS